MCCCCCGEKVCGSIVIFFFMIFLWYELYLPRQQQLIQSTENYESLVNSYETFFIEIDRQEKTIALLKENIEQLGKQLDDMVEAERLPNRTLFDLQQKLNENSVLRFQTSCRVNELEYLIVQTTIENDILSFDLESCVNSTSSDQT